MAHEMQKEEAAVMERVVEKVREAFPLLADTEKYYILGVLEHAVISHRASKGGD